MILCSALRGQEKRSYFGIRIGVGGSTLSGLEDAGRVAGSLPGMNLATDHLKVTTQFAWDLGFTYQYEFGKDNFFQSDFLVSRSGANLRGAYSMNEEGEMDVMFTNINLLYFQIPLYIGKKIRVNDTYNVVLGVGPYLAYDLPIEDEVADDYVDEGYEEDYDYSGYGVKSTKTYEEELNSNNTEFRRFDFGFMGMAGIQTKSFQMTLNPQMGLTSIIGGGASVRNRGLKVSFAFLF